MDFKNNIKKIMKENGLTLYGLDKTCDLSSNTLRSLVNQPYRNTSLRSLQILAQMLNCSIKDLIEDDPAVLYYKEIAEANKTRSLYSRNQVFSPDNREYLRKLLFQVGASCHVLPYSRYRAATVRNGYELSPIQIELSLRVVEAADILMLQVVSFYVCVNHVTQNEAIIKEAIVQALEIYAQKLHMDEIHFTIDQNFEREEDFLSNAFSELPADFSYTLGTEADFFRKHNYERSPYPYFEDYQIEWCKTLK
ncbi:helix-turn-helix domain-containing protein [Paenibacillus cymbidii]|uniref:helix-turn-helix domain-containing protein n=1 Tax=Paenibacillus cymbidii TaxID=1639034 RepID=UPI001436AF8E|nr:helix-turn-helix transcriptional regulator [Paenibacillus cymbidii]